MDRPSEKSLISFFQGRSQKEEERAIRIYLAMDIDREYVAACMRKAFPDIDSQYDPDLATEKMDLAWTRLEQRKANRFRKPMIGRKWFGYAASVLFLALLSTLYIVMKNSQGTDQELFAEDAPQDILPGGDKALLTLSDGSTISLTDAGSGEIAEQAGLQISKTGEGEIVYHPAEEVNNKEVAYNTITTPKGGQYRVTLPDGSIAKLNAASSLIYPVQFTDKQRHVKMTGEVYFEVAKVRGANSTDNLPFIVEADKQTIEVLGTTFNINAYKDEPAVRTTLLEGSVRVTASSNGKSVLLHPGQEAWVAENISVRKTDMKEQLAWVNGDFFFEKEKLSSILRKVARWYDIEVECPENLGEITFSGMVSRQQPLTEIVEVISSMKKVKLSLKGRRIIVEQ